MKYDKSCAFKTYDTQEKLIYSTIKPIKFNHMNTAPLSSHYLLLNLGSVNTTELYSRLGLIYTLNHIRNHSLRGK